MCLETCCGDQLLLYGIIELYRTGPVAYTLAHGELYELDKCSVEMYPVLQIYILCFFYIVFFHWGISLGVIGKITNTKKYNRFAFIHRI